MMNVRPAAVAGTFYPDDPEQVRALMGQCLEQAPPAGEQR